jgi:hypothetical protein
MHQRYSFGAFGKSQWPDEIELYFISAKGTPWAELMLFKLTGKPFCNATVPALFNRVYQSSGDSEILGVFSLLNSSKF